MRDHAVRALEYLGPLTADELAENGLHAFAVIHAVQIVGEAARKVPSDIRDRFPGIAWRFAVAMRNIVVHDYGEIDLSVVWTTVRDDFPPLIAALDRLLAETAE